MNDEQDETVNHHERFGLVIDTVNAVETDHDRAERTAQTDRNEKIEITDDQGFFRRIGLSIVERRALTGEQGENEDGHSKNNDEQTDHIEQKFG